MSNSRVRAKNYPVNVVHEDLVAVTRGSGELSGGKAMAAAVLRAALRKAQAEFGPGYESFEVLASSLPERWVDNWARTRLAKH